MKFAGCQRLVARVDVSRLRTLVDEVLAPLYDAPDRPSWEHVEERKRWIGRPDRPPLARVKVKSDRIFVADDVLAGPMARDPLRSGGRDVLLMSAGTDSVALAGITRKLALLPRFDYVLDHLAAIFAGVRTGDLVNRLLLLNLVVKGPFRLYPYAQDPMRWAHPFAAWSVVEQALRTPSRWKLAGGTLKQIYRTLWGDWVSSIPWETAKSGMRIPLRDRLVTPIGHDGGAETPPNPPPI